ncbi:MAG: acyltransferase family protein [Janthinobacterium lividum]
MTSIVRPPYVGRSQADALRFYRSDIDGLRAFAVLAVIFCHAGFAWSAGGFIGVDVFFTISGFVVANSILRDLKRERFSVTGFYARRARRLGPALYPVLAVTFLFSLLFCFPEDTFRLAKNILAVVTLTSNIYLSKQTGYFDGGAFDQPLLHTWSLSVEEQFYLVLPFFLLLCRHQSRTVMLSLCAIAAAASLSAAVVASSTHAGSAYYLAHNRAFEFLIGVILAVWEAERRAKQSPIYDGLYAASLVCLVYGVVTFGQIAAFPGVGALLPCLATALAIYAARRSCFMQNLLANRLAASFGRISYPIYLWHWPILFAFRRLGFSGAGADAIAIALTCFLGLLTHLTVERKAQNGPLARRRAFVAYMVVPLLGTGALAGIGKVTDGFLFAYPASIQKSIYWSGTALFDMPRAATCWSKVRVSDEKTCILGDVTSRDRAILWGDSHAYHLIHFFDRLGVDHKMAIHDVGFTLCPPIENMSDKPSDPAFTRSHRACVRHNREVMRHILARDDIGTVFLSAAWQNYQNQAAGPDAEPNLHGFLPGQLERELGTTISRLLSAGKHVLMLDDVPMIPEQLVNCAFYNGLFFPVKRRECRFDSAVAATQHAPIAAMQNRLKSRFPQIHILHTFDVPCADGQCRLDFDGLPIYRYNDYHHLSLAGSMFYYDYYRKKHPGELDEIQGRKPPTFLRFSVL